MSDGNVIHFGAPTRVDLSANEVLRAAIGDNLNHVVIIGYTEDGGFHFRTTTADLAEISTRDLFFKSIRNLSPHSSRFRALASGNQITWG